MGQQNYAENIQTATFSVEQHPCLAVFFLLLLSGSGGGNEEVGSGKPGDGVVRASSSWSGWEGSGRCGAELGRAANGVTGRGSPGEGSSCPKLVLAIC